MSTETLKEQARGFEHNREWARALEVYSRALNRMETGDEPDVSILDHAAELQIQLGKPEAALELYQRAIDLYLEAGLPNNAVAICRKVRRQIPSQVRILLKLGEVQARQGFCADARETFRSYFKIMQVRGEKERALSGLEEMVLQLPDDPRARLLLASELTALGRTEEAMIHLMSAWRRVLERGIEGELRDTLRARILELDPNTELDERKILPSGAQGFMEPASEEEGLQTLDFSGFEVMLDEDADPESGPDPVGLDVLRAEVLRAQEAGDRSGLILSLVALAEALQEEGDSEAETLFLHVLQLDAAHPVALAALGRSSPFEGPLFRVSPREAEDLYREGRLEEARQAFHDLVRRSPGDRASCEGLAQCLIDLGEPLEALQLLSSDPSEADPSPRLYTLYLLGRAQEDLGDSEGARSLYARVFELDPGFQDVAARLGRLS